MTLKRIQIGQRFVHEYDDSEADAINTNGIVIISKAPTESDHAIRLEDLGGVEFEELKRFAFFYGGR